MTRALACAAALLLAACGTPRARVGIVQGSPAVAQSGAVAEPARAAVETAVSTLPVPAGSVVTLAPPSQPDRPPEIRLAAPSELRTETRREAVEGSRAFTPPTPADAADGRARWVYRIGLALGLAAAAFGLVRGWDLVMTGGAAVAAACACAIFVQGHPALFGFIGAGLALAAAGVWIWQTKLKPWEVAPRA